MPTTNNIPGSGGHVYTREPMTSAESEAAARKFRQEHPQPPRATRTVPDYIKAPDGYPQFPVPPNWRKRRV